MLFAPGTRKDNELVLERADFAPHPIHKVPTYDCGMIHVGSGEELGASNLRVPHVELYARRIGYSVHPAHLGSGTQLARYAF